MRLSTVALGAVWLWSSVGHAYPEMIRHGYVNCTSCHLSPAGGGLLNGYGRVQAEEVLSTWSKEGQGAFLHGLIPSTEPFVSFGGNFRVLQMATESTAAVGFRAANLILMQADVEAALKLGPVHLVGTFGVQEGSMQTFLSRRHYLLYRPTDESPWAFRVGRFLPSYGIMMPDHAIGTKAGIGLGQEIESYSFETAYLGEKYDGFATVFLGRPGEDREQGVALRGGFNLGERSKIGAGYYYGKDSSSTRQLFGPYAMVGFSEQMFLLAEIDLQVLQTAGGNFFGPASYFRFNYELFKGVHAYLTGEYSSLGMSPDGYAAGAGSQWFPWPHFEFRAEYNLRNDAFTMNQSAHYMWIQAHYYL